MLLFSFMVASAATVAQEAIFKEIKPFNITLFAGHGGIHHVLLPALELRVGSISARGSLGFAYWNWGIDYEIKEICNRFLMSGLHIPYAGLIISGIVNRQVEPIPLNEFSTGYTHYYHLLADKRIFLPHICLALKVRARYAENVTYKSPPFLKVVSRKKRAR